MAFRPLVQNNITFANNFGGITDHYMGFDIGMNARFGKGGFMQGGLNTQRRLYDTCNAPILSGTTTSQVGSPEAVFCHQVFPYRPDVKFLASYTFPWDVILSAHQLSTGPTSWPRERAEFRRQPGLGRTRPAPEPPRASS